MSSKTLTWNQERPVKMPSALSTTCHSCYKTLNTLCLRAMHQMTKWRRPEEPKVAIFKDRRRAGISAVLHGIPLAAVVALITINLRPTYIGNVPTTVRGAIQFAAKLLETMIQTFLATVFLQWTRHNVLGSKPISLGSFLAPYRITNISYLWSLELWGAVTATSRRRLIIQILLTLIIIVLITLVGPSSAILMIPHLSSFPTDDIMILLGEKETVFPATVTLQNGSVV